MLMKIQQDILLQNSNLTADDEIFFGNPQDANRHLFKTLSEDEYLKNLAAIPGYERAWDEMCAEYENSKKKKDTADFMPSALPPVEDTMPSQFQTQTTCVLPFALVNILYHGIRGDRSCRNTESFSLEIPPAAYTIMIADSLGVSLQDMDFSNHENDQSQSMLTELNFCQDNAIQNSLANNQVAAVFFPYKDVFWAIYAACC
jgi:hypothetical protein